MINSIGFGIKVIVLYVCWFSHVTAVEYSKSGEGYPNGLISDCPGSTKPAAIKPKSLEKLYFSVMVSPFNLSTYNYYQMRQLAKHEDLDFSKKTFLYVGGYLDARALPISRIMGQAYKDLGYNVLLLDYLEFNSRHYAVAARLTRPVGKHVAEMLANLTNLGLDPKKLEIAGPSLGGQTISFIAKNYRRITGRNISSVTGLDPSGPCFRHLGPEERLDSSDADLVRVISTNIDGFGMATPVGHVTFYVNGGEFQPGDVWWFPCGIFCSHIRSYLLWLSGLLNPGILIGMQCDSVQQARDADCYDRKPMVTNTLDLFTDRNKPGIYYLHTFNRYPYGLGKSGLKRSGEVTLKHLAALNPEDTLWVK